MGTPSYRSGSIAFFAAFNIWVGFGLNALAQERPYVSPLPEGSGVVPDDNGRLVRCSPPPGKKIPNFKVLCDQYIRENRLARVAIPDRSFSRSDWITSADYPRELLGSRKQGQVMIEVSISEAGVVTGCEVLKSSGVLELDKAACDATLRKARFLSRLDRDGKPAPASYTRWVRWVAR